MKCKVWSVKECGKNTLSTKKEDVLVVGRVQWYRASQKIFLEITFWVWKAGDTRCAEPERKTSGWQAFPEQQLRGAEIMSKGSKLLLVKHKRLRVRNLQWAVRSLG